MNSCLKQKLEQTDQKPKALIRFYFYTALSGQYGEDLPELEQYICQKCGITPQQLSEKIEERSQKWTLKIAECEDLISRSYFVDKYIKDNSSRISRSTMKPDVVRELLTSFLCLVLQNASFISGKNHLKKKDVILLLQLLEDPEVLAPYVKYITRPISRAIKGGVTPTSYKYLMHMFGYIHLLSEYYLDYPKDKAGRMAICCHILENLRDWSNEEIARFLGRDTEPKSNIES